MNSQRPELPIDRYLARIVSTLDENNCLIIEAPPGTGKTTRAAPALLSLKSRSDRANRVLLIQPRRIAARAAAARIAAEWQVDLGELIGYQIRFDSRISAATRLIAMTPGILLRQLQSNAVLESVAAVVLDEFHERSLEYDLLLGMLRRIQTELRPELKLVVMSATLDSPSIERYLNQPPVIRVDAKAFPVEIQYSRFRSRTSRGRTPPSPSRGIVEQAIEVTRQAAKANAGDILVFLPGVGEILQVERALQPDADKAHWRLMTLYGDLPPQEQDRVLAPSERRKIVLATNVAETSLTIDGVRVVVDSGWARVQRIDPTIGLNMLLLEPISNASADQRAGRAGRTAPGICYRLWDEITGRSRADHLEPEVLRVDLTGAVLQLMCWGELDIARFPWITAPHDSAIVQALEALQLIGAIRDGRVTELGRSINKLPVQPRLARLLIEGHASGVPAAAATAAALLSERDVFERRSRAQAGFGAGPHSQNHACDVTRQVLALHQFASTGRIETDAGTIRIGAARHALRVAQQLQQLLIDELGPCEDRPLEEQLQRALLAAFPDRVAKRRSPANQRGLMVGGRGVKLDDSSGVQRSDLFLCLDVDAAGSEANVRKASSIEVEWLPKEHLSQRDDRFFNPTQGAVVSRRRSCFLDLVLSETPIETDPDEATARQLARAAAERFERLLPAKDKGLHSWIARVRWLSYEMPNASLPSFEASQLAETMADWCYGLRKLDEVKQLPWKSLLEGLLTSESRKLLDAQAPESIRLPSGRTALLQYEVGKPPVLAARIQEFFGWRETPRLAGGRVPLLLHLLAPNGRVQQITDDLASFWAKTYPGVRKELRGRYPKHAWPENPL